MSTYLLRRIALWHTATRWWLLWLCCVSRSVLLGSISSCNSLNRLLCIVAMLWSIWSRWLLQSRLNTPLLLMVQDLSRSTTHACQDKLDPTYQLSWRVRKRRYNSQCPPLIQFHPHLHKKKHAISPFNSHSQSRSLKFIHLPSSWPLSAIHIQLSGDCHTTSLPISLFNIYLSKILMSFKYHLAQSKDSGQLRLS